MKDLPSDWTRREVCALVWNVDVLPPFRPRWSPVETRDFRSHVGLVRTGQKGRIRTVRLRTQDGGSLRIRPISLWSSRTSWWVYSLVVLTPTLYGVCRGGNGVLRRDCNIILQFINDVPTYSMNYDYRSTRRIVNC